MKVVVDTNVLISAVIRDRDPEKVIRYLTRQTNITWVVSPEILAEYLNVLARPKFRLSALDYHEWVSLVLTSTELISPMADFDFPRDRKDAKFLTCFLAAQADYLITGDRDFESIEADWRTRIVTANQFKLAVMPNL